jgi:hypothetical protein
MGDIWVVATFKTSCSAASLMPTVMATLVIVMAELVAVAQGERCPKVFSGYIETWVSHSRSTASRAKHSSFGAQAVIFSLLFESYPSNSAQFSHLCQFFGVI